MADFFASLRARLSALLGRNADADQWAAPGNAVTRAIESGRDLAELEPTRTATVPRQAAPVATSTLLERIEAVLAEPIIEEPARIIITDDNIAPYVDDPAIEEGVLKPREEKKTKKRWWRAA